MEKFDGTKGAASASVGVSSVILLKGRGIGCS